MWGNNAGESKGLLPGRQTLGPLSLIIICPLVVQLLVHWCMHDSFEQSYQLIINYINGVDGAKEAATIFFAEVFPAPSSHAGTLITVFSISQLFLMRFVPAGVFVGPETATGHKPVYKANGLQCFIISLLGFLAVSRTEYGKSELVWVYDNYSEVISTLNLFSLLFCAVLYVKGLSAPSTTDFGSSGNAVMDYYWGTELYPRIFGWDVKQFTNCRFGLTLWSLLPFTFAVAQHAKTGHVSAAMFVNGTC